jgi:hypothetical protein
MQNKIKVLSEIIQSIQSLYDSENNVLRNSGRDILNISQNGQAERYENSIGNAAEFGIDNLLFNAYHIDLAIPDPLSVLFVNKNVLHSNQNVKSDFQVKDIKEILKRCKVVSFTSWTSFQEASHLWDRLRTDVIKPIGRKDFEFIFYMGDTTKKLAYEVDEILDIISDFSFSGKVTLVLTDREASQLWKTLNGQKDNIKSSFTGINNYESQYIFNTVNIDRLLVYSPDHRVTIFSKEGSLELKGRNLYSINATYKAQNYFDAGYILGLLLQLSTVHCTAIGLAVAGASLRNEAIHDLQTLLAYIKDWIEEEDKRKVFGSHDLAIKSKSIPS